MTAREVDVVIEEDAEGAARRVAELLAVAARDGEEIVLTGGSTPGRAYELAAELEPEWSGAGIWWSDERCVPPDDERSNFRLARKTLLDHLNGEPRVHRIRGEADPDVAADEYDAELRGVALDLIVLGLGPDGHVASLFPNEPSLEERKWLAIHTEAHLEPFVDRVSLTVPALRSGRKVAFLVTGEAKSEAVARALAGDPDPAVPGSLVRSESGKTLAFLDRAAAGKLQS
ncbi:MAG: 6-phosphogluconolactonase [Actinomycetota bacterium]|nr:6-phosphogluconolactonase [Actinomycetota bacterium]